MTCPKSPGALGRVGQEIPDFDTSFNLLFLRLLEKAGFLLARENATSSLFPLVLGKALEALS